MEYVGNTPAPIDQRKVKELPKNDLIHFKHNKTAYATFLRLREEILERDGWQCRFCGLTELRHYLQYGTSLHVDHIDGNTLNNRKTNLQALCMPCNINKDRHTDRLMARSHERVDLEIEDLELKKGGETANG